MERLHPIKQLRELRQAELDAWRTRYEDAANDTGYGAIWLLRTGETALVRIVINGEWVTAIECTLIRERREERGLSQEGLAKAVGLKRPSMSNIENGRQNILLHTLCDIAETLDTNTDALLPEAAIHQPVTMPDLGAFSKEVREFLEAGIKTVEKGGKLDHGDSTTKN